MGDRQITYGILWHLWQYAEERENRMRKEEASAASVNADSLREPEERDTILNQPKTDKTKGDSTHPEKTNVSSRVSPILLDIPASVLAGGKNHRESVRFGFSEESSSSPHSNLSMWKLESPFDHDLFPLPNLLSPTCSASKSTPELRQASASEPQSKGGEVCDDSTSYQSRHQDMIANAPDSDTVEQAQAACLSNDPNAAQTQKSAAADALESPKGE